ncbi:hypothetical protein HGRIS_011408 [Hohenbuehelia grisea]|uniref:Uncharacterized protein n=1 Tax=Hohenbuehelia grisea TaxID=104357 RepID=A0ABR3JWC7_9AGAR
MDSGFGECDRTLSLKCLEGYGVGTFSAKEMALNGRMDRLPDLAGITTTHSHKPHEEGRPPARAIARDNSADFKMIINGVSKPASAFCSAKTALELGAPIRGILAFTSTSTDTAGRSVPAPGRCALAIAREIPSSKHPLPILDPVHNPPGAIGKK